MFGEAKTRKQPQGKPGRELTAADKKKIDETIRNGLREEWLPIQEIHRRVNDSVGFVVAKQAFKKHLDDIRADFQANSGFVRESLMDIVDTKLKKILTNPKSSGELLLKTIKEADRLFDLKRKPEEDAVAIAKVVEQEMTRIRGLSDDALMSYAEQLKNPLLDDEFNNLVEAQKRGMLYAIENGEVRDSKKLAQNLTHKTRTRKPPKRKEQPPQEQEE
jgi:hypothetical protein